MGLLMGVPGGYSPLANSPWIRLAVFDLIGKKCSPQTSTLNGIEIVPQANAKLIEISNNSIPNGDSPKENIKNQFVEAADDIKMSRNKLLRNS